MLSDRMPMTPSGLVKLKQELKRLKGVERQRIVREIAEARAHGDLSENAEYHAAKEKQSHVEGRITQVEHWIATADVIDVSKLSGDRVVFGATVHLTDSQSGDEVQYRIVGELEADLKLGRISVTSPIARALIGKVEGDVVRVRAPGGEREYEIGSVEFVEEPASSCLAAKRSGAKSASSSRAPGGAPGTSRGAIPLPCRPTPVRRRPAPRRTRRFRSRTRARRRGPGPGPRPLRPCR
jgi:transcription elongation factor GreA